ncbi:YadA-like family protein, partial [Luteimonas sp. RD2P54]
GAFGDTAFGAVASATGGSSTALGSFSQAGGGKAIAVGSQSQASAEGAVVVGMLGSADAVEATALGTEAVASAARSVALGAHSVADQADTVSVGAAGSERRVVNVAAASQATDAVNLSQLQATLATANAYTDTAVATGGTAANAYTDDREAAIRGDMEAGDAAALSAANAYTDQAIEQLTGFGEGFDAFRAGVDRRFEQQDERIGRVGALNAAMIGMAASAAAVEDGQSRLGFAVGEHDGKQAFSIGLQQRIGKRAALTVGGAFSGSERSTTLGVGIGF